MKINQSQFKRKMQFWLLSILIPLFSFGQTEPQALQQEPKSHPLRFYDIEIPRFEKTPMGQEYLKKTMSFQFEMWTNGVIPQFEFPAKIKEPPRNPKAVA